MIENETTEYLKIPQLTEIFNCSYAKIFQTVKKNNIPSIKDDGPRRYLVSALAPLLQKKPRGRPPKPATQQESASPQITVEPSPTEISVEPVSTEMTEIPAPVVKRGRGRPRKPVDPNPLPKRGRGRPKKMQYRDLTERSSQISSEEPIGEAITSFFDQTVEKVIQSRKEPIEAPNEPSKDSYIDPTADRELHVPEYMRQSKNVITAKINDTVVVVSDQMGLVMVGMNKAQMGVTAHIDRKYIRAVDPLNIFKFLIDSDLYFKWTEKQLVIYQKKLEPVERPDFDNLEKMTDEIVETITGEE